MCMYKLGSLYICALILSLKTRSTIAETRVVRHISVRRRIVDAIYNSVRNGYVLEGHMLSAANDNLCMKLGQIRRGIS